QKTGLLSVYPSSLDFDNCARRPQKIHGKQGTTLVLPAVPRHDILCTGKDLPGYGSCRYILPLCCLFLLQTATTQLLQTLPHILCSLPETLLKSVFLEVSFRLPI